MLKKLKSIFFSTKPKDIINKTICDSRGWKRDKRCRL